MKIEKNTTEKALNTLPLKNISPGAVFRFAQTSFTEALKTDSFYMRVDAPEVKDNRCRIVNLTDGKQMERDGDWQVITSEAVLQVKE